MFSLIGSLHFPNNTLKYTSGFESSELGFRAPQLAELLGRLRILFLYPGPWPTSLNASSGLYMIPIQITDNRGGLDVSETFPKLDEGWKIAGARMRSPRPRLRMLEIAARRALSDVPCSTNSNADRCFDTRKRSTPSDVKQDAHNKE